MTTYMYCPTCKKVTIVEIRSKGDGAQAKICTDCGAENRKALQREECPVCGNILYVPFGMRGIAFPCAEQHGRASAQDDGRDGAVGDMLEIPCQNCPKEILRLKDGVYETCPNCGRAPTMAYIQKRWRRHANREADILQWSDSTGQKMLHVDKRSGNIPPCTLLVVSAGQHVVYDGDGGRKTLRSEVYTMFKDDYSEEDKIKLLNQAQNPAGLSLGLGTRIIFFSESKFPFVAECAFPRLNNKWSVVIPISFMMKMTAENADNLMEFAMDLTDDDKATACLKNLVCEKTSAQFFDLYLDHRKDEALREVQDEFDVINWVRSLLPDEKKEEIRVAAEGTLVSRYGIELPILDIHSNKIEVTNLMNTVDVPCTAINDFPRGTVCGRINKVPKADYDNHKPITCDKCHSKLYWCSHCSGYRTTLARDNVCDKCGYRIY